MRSIRTEGVVLKKMNIGEADKILTIFTLDYGKIKVMAKGIRKIKSKLAGSLEQFMLLDLRLVEGKTFFIPTDVVIIDELSNIHINLKNIAKCFYVAEIIDKLFEENQSHPEAFVLLKDILRLINHSEKEIVLRIAELKLIESAGFKPELDSCVHCKELISAGENYWDDVEGGLICANCFSKYHHGSRVDDDVIKILRFIGRNELGSACRLKIAPSILIELEKILQKYIESVLERELKSRKFLKMI